MGQPSLFPGGRPPGYHETQAEAYAKLVKSGRDLAQDERVRLAIAYLQPCTREDLYEWLATPHVPGLPTMKSSSVSRSVNTLIVKKAQVRVIAKIQGKFGNDVEVLELGLDERVKRKKGRLLEQPILPGFPRPRRPLDDPSLAVGAVFGAIIATGVWFVVWALRR